jgi:predicted  nucleic acid-binding Zn-ribbon protein
MPHQCTACGRTFQDGSKEMLSGCPDCGGNKFQFMPASAVDDGGAAGATTAKKSPEESPQRSSGDDRGAVETGGDGSSSAVGRAAATVRDWVSTREDDESGRATATDSTPASTDSTPTATGSTRNDGASTRSDTASARSDPASTRNGGASNAETPTDQIPGGETAATEDSAQASARSDVVSEAELPDKPAESASVPDAEDRPDDSTVVDAPEDENPGLKELRQELNSQFESIRIVNPGHYELNLMELYEREEYIISLQEDGKYVIEVPDAWEQTER